MYFYINWTDNLYIVIHVQSTLPKTKLNSLGLKKKLPLRPKRKNGCIGVTRPTLKISPTLVFFIRSLAIAITIFIIIVKNRHRFSIVAITIVFCCLWKTQKCSRGQNYLFTTQKICERRTSYFCHRFVIHNTCICSALPFGAHFRWFGQYPHTYFAPEFFFAQGLCVGLLLMQFCNLCKFDF